MSYKRSWTTYENDHKSNDTPFVFYGTALPPLNSDTRDDGSFVPLWKQEVRDEHGRKRLHGAFTGGFSAGYFNTVGSKEGWTPSAFVSSRTQRHQHPSSQPDAQRLQQYMDDEDLTDLQQTQKLETRVDFAGIGGDGADGLQRNALLDIFKPSEDTVGIKLLQKMGWRLGQGIGAKVTRRPDSGSASHSFAPSDTHMVTFRRKTDSFGLGYEKGDRLADDTAKSSEDEQDDSSSAFSLRKPSKPKPTAPKRSGFGVGVLNDTGSDEDDPYELGPKISYNKIIGGGKSKRKGGLAANPVKSPSVVIKGGLQPWSSKKTSAAITGTSPVLRRCHDGRLPLEGFTFGTSTVALHQSPESRYTPPPVPQGWQPRRIAAMATPNDDNHNKPSMTTTQAAKTSTLDPKSRAAMLGETTLPGKSIFDYMTPAARERLVAATGRTDLPQAKSEPAPAGYTTSASDKQRRLWELVPRLDPSIAQEALDRAKSGWMPYADDLEKRGRYRAFIEGAVGLRHELPERKPYTSDEDWTNEMNEFLKAAQVFRPISGLMAGRFTSSTSTPTTTSSENRNGDSTSDAKTKPPDPAVEAARLGMFGPMTRSRENFYPTRLTCKRFGVRPPDHVTANEQQSAESNGRAHDSRLDVLGSVAMEGMAREVKYTVDQKERGRSDGGKGLSFVSGGLELPATMTDSSGTLQSHGHIVPTGPALVDVETNDAIESQRAGDELFKAVFGSDEDDDDDS